MSQQAQTGGRIYRSEGGDIDLAFTGDALITRAISHFDEPGFLSVVRLLHDADAAITNAEVLFHDFEHSPGVAPGGSYMRADPRLIEQLRWMGFSMLSAANNHGYDYGEAGLLTSLGHLEESGVVFAGIGRTMAQAREPRYLETRAGRVALISVTSSGPQGMYAGDQWRDGSGRPGANMLRYTSHYTVDAEIFAALRRMRDELGLQERRSGPQAAFRNHSWGLASLPETETEFYLGDLHNEFQYPVPSGYRIKLGERCSVTLVPDERDLAENVQRIKDARRMADWVVVSMHNHEHGLTADDPSNVATVFAHAAIDAGADVFHGHGPHRDRGIEIYRGKPIFYSIGHFINHNDTVTRQGLEVMRRQGLANPWEATPADLYDARSGREWMDEWLPGTYAADPDLWRDFVARVRFRSRELAEIALYPIDLGFRRPRSQRGRPVLAGPEQGEALLAHLRALAEPFGTAIDVRDGVGYIHLTSSRDDPAPA